ncbi:MAG: PGPGW domain-containing protein [Myxococcales bacterium]|nr:PGPGW domain-containing protein [Myxococcales bacterium]
MLVVVVGGLGLLAGAAMLVLPGPGTLVIVASLAFLATEFPWARRLLRRARRQLARARRRLRQRRAGRDDTRVKSVPDGSRQADVRAVALPPDTTSNAAQEARDDEPEEQTDEEQTDVEQPDAVSDPAREQLPRRGGAEADAHAAHHGGL